MKTLFKLFIGFVLMLCTGLALASSYTIKSGDTLSAIAKTHQTNIAAIMAENPSIKNPDRIYAGRSLVLPSLSIATRPNVQTIIALPKHQQHATVASVSVPDQCASARTINRLFAPDVAQEISSQVASDIQSGTDAISTSAIRTYSAQRGSSVFTFEISPNCTFAKIERLATDTTVALTASHQDPPGPPIEEATSETNSDRMTALSLRNTRREETATHPQQALRAFLQDAIGAPYNVEPIVEGMIWRAQLAQWGVKLE